MKLVSERTKQIAKQPFINKSADYKDTRVTTLGNFSIYYKINHKEIIITAFWDNRQNQKKLLKILEGKR